MNLPTNPPLPRRRFRRIPKAAALLVCGFSLLFTDCVRREPRADIVIVNGIEPETLDPALVLGVSEGRIVSGLFEGLTRVNPKTALPDPGLASHWEISPDGRIYTFHLRTNLVWSTGEPITSADVVYSWIRALKPETASEYAGQLFYLKNAEDFNSGKIKDPNLVGVHAIDPYTVRVELTNPTAFFLDLCAFPTLEVVPRQTIEKYGDKWIMAKPLPSSGPYEMMFWHLNDRIRLRKNPRYWDAANTRIEVADFLPLGSPITALNLYETGGVDLVWDKDLVPTELLDVLMKRPDFHSYTILGTYFIRCNTTRKPFNDVRVRQALGYAIDRERITKKITRAGEVPATHFTPPGIGHYHAPEGLGYDPDKARKLLAEAGYPGGKGFPRFTYMFNASAGGASLIHAKIAVELQQMWRDTLGIDMELRQVEWKVYLSDENKLDYDTSRDSWIGDYNDPDTFLNLFMTDGGNNRTGWGDPHYDDLIRSADKENDPAKRQKYLYEAESILLTNGPVIPIFYYVGFNYYHTNIIHGIYENVLDNHPLNAIWKTPATPTKH
ncbi:MAG TPA: peptide ABC transporter substrate-binding protein [Verrucomicrobiae bacterium]|jgi:oligopeptide transport system substrate-binding protein|nr:peptide ABC transporter substrate-binding protein [Verrucomicrobiae bacterium]